MQQSGTSDLLAGWLQGALSGWSQTLILLALFAVVAVITQLMSDAATTALFAPVAVILAQALGHPPETYAVTVAMAAVASFLTPRRPPRKPAGLRARGYQFTVSSGSAPSTILVALVVTWPAPRSGPTNSMRRQLRPTDSERQIGGSPSDPLQVGTTTAAEAAPVARERPDPP